MPPQDIALIRGVADLVARTELGQNYEISSYGGIYDGAKS